MKTFDDQALFIKGEVKFTLLDVLELYKPTQEIGPQAAGSVIRIPVITIRNYKAGRGPFEPPHPAEFDGARLAIDPEVEPLLKHYYSAPLEAALSRSRHEMDQVKREACRISNTLRQEKANGDELYCRIKRFNDLSFWGKLGRILRGEDV